MMFLPGLAVIFAGLIGGNGDVDSQLKTMLQKLHVKPVSMPVSKLQLLTHHGDATRALVKSLHVDGVIACEIVKGHGAASLRIVIYEGDGKLKTFSEVPLTGKKLGRSDLEVLSSNLADDVTDMRGSEPDAEPAEVAAAEPEPAKPEPAKKPEPAPKQLATPTKPAPTRPAPAKTEPDVAIVDEEEATTPVDVAAADDAVSADEIASLTGGSEESSSAMSAHALHLGASAGIGLATRSFNPGPSTVLGYDSTPVAAIVVDAHVRPTKKLGLAIGVERSLSMSTPMRDGSLAPTTISRWEAGGTYTLMQRGSFDLDARLGGGRRAFSMISVDPARSPDGDYNYVIVGVAATAHLGERIALRTAAAFEPVLFGNEPTEMAFGEASRWALEVGAAVEVRASQHVFVRATAQYQRFTWSWDMAGERGAGGAIDEYPSGAIALGADY
ncbi:MAG TPA: hypothetical protein VIV40_38235 [Kofleriaceae bacterium]